MTPYHYDSCGSKYRRHHSPGDRGDNLACAVKSSVDRPSGPGGDTRSHNRTQAADRTRLNKGARNRAKTDLRREVVYGD